MKPKQNLAALFRIVSVVVLVLLQAGALVGMFNFFRQYFAHFYAVCELISLFVVLAIVREDTNPTYKIPWIILLLVFPILGGPLYLMFGRLRFNSGEKRRGAEITKAHREAISLYPSKLEELPLTYRAGARYLQKYAYAPVFTNTQVTFFPLGEAMFETMIKDLEQAEKFIFMEYFIIAPGKMWDTILEILTRKAKQGVDVRVVYDDVGCLGLLPGHYARSLEQRGIQCRAFNRFTNIFSSRFNNRDHRKICVIDGNVGFTGGVNLADEYINETVKHGHWKDTAVRLHGEGVFGLTVMFLSMWNFELGKVADDMKSFAPTETGQGKGFIQLYTDVPLDREYVGQTVYMNMLARAQDYVYITSPYLIIDSEMITALTMAAKNGIDVRIITPGIPDKKIVYRLTRSYYEVLLRAGVRIYQYTPGFIHAKEFIADDRNAVIGTINLDYRSLCHHYECAAWLCDVPAIAQMKADYLQTLEQSREITLDDCRRRGLAARIGLSILRIFAPLF